ncbi:MAG: ArsR family transcriptional regulator [Bacteroidales bacterium]
MLDTLITSKTRIKLILRFFLNPKSTAYLRGLAEEFGESSNAIRLELNRFEEAGLLQSETQGNKKLFKANTLHPLYCDIHNIVRKVIGIDQIVDEVVKELGEVQEAYVTGDFAVGRDSPAIDIVLVGNHLNTAYLIRLVEKAEKLIHRRIRYLILSPEEAKQLLKENRCVLIWKKTT